MSIFDPDEIGPEIAARMSVRGSWGYVAGQPERIPKPKIIPRADPNEAMREVLEVMISHSGEIICGCDLCSDYLNVRALLLGKVL